MKTITLRRKWEGLKFEQEYKSGRVKMTSITYWTSTAENIKESVTVNLEAGDANDRYVRAIKKGFEIVK